MKLERPLAQDVEGRLELEAVLEEVDPREDVEAEPRPRHGDDEAADVAEVADVVGADEGEEDEVVLLALVLVHRRDLVRGADHGIVGAPAGRDGRG